MNEYQTLQNRVNEQALFFYCSRYVADNVYMEKNNVIILTYIFYIYQEKMSVLRHVNCLSAERRSKKDEIQIVPVPCNNMLPSLCSLFNGSSISDILDKGIIINEIYNVINKKI